MSFPGQSPLIGNFVSQCWQLNVFVNIFDSGELLTSSPWLLPFSWPPVLPVQPPIVPAWQPSPRPGFWHSVQLSQLGPAGNRILQNICVYLHLPHGLFPTGHTQNTSKWRCQLGINQEPDHFWLLLLKCKSSNFTSILLWMSELLTFSVRHMPSIHPSIQIWIRFLDTLSAYLHFM